MRWLRVSMGVIGGLIAAAPVQAAVVINEILPNPVGDDTENEWVELYNTDSTSVSIEGYVLEDKNDKQMTLTGSVDKWLVVYPKGTINLTNSGSTIKLIIGGQMGDSFSYGQSSEGKSFGRIPDGGEILSDKLTPTAGTANAPEPTPAPTPSPTLAPTTNPVPKTSMPSPVVTPTPAPSRSPMVLAVKGETNFEEINLAASSATTPPTALAEATVSGENRQGWSVVPVLIGGGVVLSLAGLLPVVRKWYHEKSWLKTDSSTGGDRSSFGQE